MRKLVFLAPIILILMYSCGDGTPTGPSENLAYPDSISRSLSVPGKPSKCCIHPSGDHLYIVNTSESRIDVVDLNAFTITAHITAWESGVNDICISPSGEYVYASTGQGCSVVRTSDNSVVSNVAMGGQPGCICISPSGEYVYVARYDPQEGHVYVLETATNTVVKVIIVTYMPSDICCLPSGTHVYVAAIYGNVDVIRTSDNEVVAVLDGMGSTLCATPDDQFVYVGYADTIRVIRTSDNTVVDTVLLSKIYTDMCIVPSGEYLYVAKEQFNDVGVIRTLDNSVQETLQVPEGPYGLAVAPDGETLYVTNYDIFTFLDQHWLTEII